MRLLIFGSTGSVGRLLVEQALAENHQVHADHVRHGDPYKNKGFLFAVPFQSHKAKLAKNRLNTIPGRMN